MSSKVDLFEKVPMMNVPRNFFDLSHEVKMSGKFGYLYPFLLTETMPGDTFNEQATCFMRVAPLLRPIMHAVDLKTDFFFVPMRLITDLWEEFITGGQDGTAAPVLPYVTPAGITAGGDPLQLMVGTLWDYMGLPTYDNVSPLSSTEQISILPFRAYQKVYNDYFRDPNLDAELDLDTEVAGNVSATSEPMLTIRRRGWQRDFFTAALPWAQRGAEVLMPLSGTGPVVWSDDALGMPIERTAGGVPANGNVQSTGGNWRDSGGVAIRPGANAATAELTSSDVSINDFRRSLAIQKWLENNARGGGRYIEQIQSHYRVRVPDYRLQRSEYLGGGRQPVQISEVLSTDGNAGNMRGHGISVGKSSRFKYHCQEHGYIIGVISVTPRTAYMQGLPKLFTRTSKYDFAFPELANLGEQEIRSKELFYSFDTADDADNNEVFGYIPRYAEYKFMVDRVSGDFRTTLTDWHLTRIFNSRPVLDTSFVTMIEDNVVEEETYRRIFQVQDGTDYLWMQIYHRFTAKRPLPYYGVPQI